MEVSARQAVQLIHKTPTMAVVYVTGGASTALSWLLSEPGASNTVLQASVPYARSSFIQLVGPSVAQSISNFASLEASRALACTAYTNAVQLASAGDRVVGIAATCALITNTPKRGPHQVHVVAHAAERIVEYAIQLEKGVRTRTEEEKVSSLLVLQAMLDDCGATNPLSLSISRESRMSLLRDHLRPGDKLNHPVVHDFSDALRAVVDGHAKYAEKHGDRWNRDANRATLIFPGSFNPLHDGHRRLMQVAQSMYPDDVSAFELSITNPDKAQIDYHQIMNRIKLFSASNSKNMGISKSGIIISRAAMFGEKAKLYGAVRFIVGIDTAVRILDPKYYPQGLIEALLQMKSAGCSFIVAGRLEQRKDGVKSNLFQTLNNVDVNIPEGFESMFEEIDESSFRADVSSSEIRARMSKQ